MLTLILGPSGSGKSRLLLERLRARATAGQQSILIVPEQFTSSTEGALYHSLGDHLSALVDSYSFTSLAEALLRRYGGAAVPTLSEAGRAVLIRRAVDSLLDQIVYYRRQRHSAAFCEKAAQTIEELKSAGIDPDTLAEYARATGADREKLSELSLIYGAYQGLLSQSAMDPGDRQQLAADMLDAAFFAGRGVYIDEFDTFNAPKRALLEAMLPVADVTVSLCCDSEQDREGGMGLFSGAKQVAARLKRMAAVAGVDCHTELLQGDRRHLENGVLAELNLLLADPGYTPEQTVDAAAPEIVYYAAASRQAEAKAVAAAIAARVRAGTPYRRMVVICRDIGSYLSAIRYEFRLQNIPLFCDEASTPENTAPARAVHAALDLVRGGISSRTMLRLLKTGLVDLPETEQAALENYAYTWPLKAGDWREPFQRSAAGYAGNEKEEDQQTLLRAERARSVMVTAAQKFMAAAKGRDAAGLTKQIYLFLADLGAEKVLSALAETLRDRGRLPQADEALREWNTVMELLNQLALLLGEEALPPAEYDELFTLLLRATDMGHIPQSLDSVILTSAGRMRLPETDACFVVGLQEGTFPQTPGDSGLLSHADRDAMKARGADLPDSFENKLLREGICFYKALTAAGRFLWLSWPGAAGQEDQTPASAAVTPVLELLAVPPAVLPLADYGAAPAAALDLLGGLWNTPGSAAQSAAVRLALEGLENGPAAVPGYAAVRRAAADRPDTVRDPRALEALLGREMRISPTRFERYASCPFGYFMQYILKALPRQKAELAPNISGTLTHWVLEQALKQEGAHFKEMTEEEIAALVEALTARYVAENLPGITVRMQYLVERIARNLVRLLGFIQLDIRQSGFVPVAFELRIADREDAEKPSENSPENKEPIVEPVRLEDGIGHTVRIIGTIDRVDAMPLQGKTYLRVVDYKTGNKKFDLREVYCGLDCQMLLYLFTLERNGHSIFPGAVGAGVEYLLADPAPQTVPRAEALAEDAEKQDETADAYPLDGLLLDEESVYRAMDTKATGAFVPLKFNAKTGKASGSHLADAEKLARIRDHLDGLLIQMAKRLYTGEIAAAPLCPGSTAPCGYCDYRPVCGHRDGENERRLTLSKDPFEEEPTDTQ